MLRWAAQGVQGVPDFRHLPAITVGGAAVAAGAASGLMPAIYFDTSAVIITLILLGRLLEARAKAHASDAIKKLLAPPEKPKKPIGFHVR